MKVIITGASGYFGRLLAQRLRSDPEVDFEVVGIDTRPEPMTGHSYKLLSGDTRKKRIEDLFKTEGRIDAVVHLARETSPRLTSDEMMMTNVYGTFHILELCLKYGVGVFIFPSSSIVYGARKDNPALIREDFPLLGNRDYPFIRDRVEADMICQTFGQSCSINPRVVILRMSPIWRTGGTGSPLSTFMQGEIVPIPLGFDPMFQIIFDSEVLEAFILAIKNQAACGVYNIPGHIFMPLSKVIRRLGKKSIQVPEFVIENGRHFLWSEHLKFDVDYLKYPFAVDGARARNELGYNP